MKNKQTLIITGSTSQIGCHIVEAFAESNTRFILHTHRNTKEAERLKKKILAKSKSNEVIILSADLSTHLGIQQFTKQLIPYGPFDFFLHNAGLFTQDPLEKLMTLHMTAGLEISRKIAPHMKKGSHITFISDIGAHIPFKKHLNYCISKGAILSLTRSLAVELAPTVLVNCLTLGIMVPAKTESKKIQKILANKTLLKRWGGWKEVLRAIQFLRNSQFITGTEIIMDGGYHLVPRV